MSIQNEGDLGSDEQPVQEGQLEGPDSRRVQKRAEHEARRLIAAMPMGMHLYRLEPDDRLIFEGYNPSAEAILGVDHRPFLGKTLEESFPPLVDTDIPRRYREVADHGLTWRTEQLTYAEGDIAGAFQVWAVQTGPGRMAAIFEEITARKRLEVELQRYRDRLEDLVEERTNKLGLAQEALVRKERLATLGQLTGSVAHELRNPLGAVRSAVFALREAVESGEPEQTLLAADLAERCVVRCDAIIEDLLSYSRVGQLRLQPTDMDAWVAAQLDEQLPDDLSCTRKLDSGVETPVDREKLGRALVNVFTNAVQAMSTLPLRERHLTVTTEVEGERLLIRFRDVGVGIEEGLLDRVCEPLFSTKTRGVGLGLPTVVNILKQHHGEVRLESRHGSGTTVTLELPLTTPEAAARQ